MVRQRLTELLEELHEEFEKSQDIDPATRAQLQEVADELDEFLGKEDDEHEQGIIERLRERLLNLEVEHRRVSTIIGETLDLLARLGV
jgi:polyhydroxyalkanoate synthesis regulator phasin